MTDKILVSRELLERVKEYVDLDSHTLTELQVALSAPVQQVVLPARVDYRNTLYVRAEYQIGWNACLDEIARLNRKPIQQEPVAYILADAVGGSALEFQQHELYESQQRYGGHIEPLYLHPAPADAALVEALENIAEYWNRDANEQAMQGACWHAIETAEAALAAYRAAQEGK